MFDKLALLKQKYKKLKGAEVTMLLASFSKFQWTRKEDERMEDLEVRTVLMIIEGFELPTAPECPFTRLRKKDDNQYKQHTRRRFQSSNIRKGKTMSFRDFPRKNDNSTNEEDDNFVFTSPNTWNN